MKFGINLSFAVKRWVEPEVWAKLVRETLDLDLVQFTYDLLDPWWPEPVRRQLAGEVRRAAQNWGIQIESAFSGLANYCFDGLLHPQVGGRQAAIEWWKRAFDVAVEIGAKACGGPLGGLSVADEASPESREQRYRDLLDSLEELGRAAVASGLEEVQVESTPLTREVPHSIDQVQKLLKDLEGRSAVPVTVLIDVGHALYQPLYGPNATMSGWLRRLGGSIGAFHLQNTDFHSDSHWGWPDKRGLFDVASFAREVKSADLDDVPAFLEVIYPFELADQEVLENIVSSVSHCRREYVGAMLAGR